MDMLGRMITHPIEMTNNITIQGSPSNNISKLNSDFMNGKRNGTPCSNESGIKWASIIMTILFSQCFVRDLSLSNLDQTHAMQNPSTIVKTIECDNSGKKKYLK
jgi:hypothetical protein